MKMTPTHCITGERIALELKKSQFQLFPTKSTYLSRKFNLIFVLLGMERQVALLLQKNITVKTE